MIKILEYANAAINLHYADKDDVNGAGHFSVFYQTEAGSMHFAKFQFPDYKHRAAALAESIEFLAVGLKGLF